MNVNVNVKKARGRKRRALGWTLMAVGMLVAVVWYYDRWWWWGECRWCGVRLEGSVVGVVWGDGEQRRAYADFESNMMLVADVFPDRDPWLWRRHDPGSGWRPPAVLVVRFPVWPLMVASLAGGAALIWSVRRRRPGQRRVALGWGALSAGLVLGGVWVSSGWTSVPLTFAPLWLTFHRGLVQTEIESGDGGWLRISRLGYWLYAHEEPSEVRLGSSGSLVLWSWHREGSEMIMPVWPLVIGCVAAGVPLVRWGLRARRHAGSACAECGYDMAGLAGLAVGAVCPECGRKTT